MKTPLTWTDASSIDLSTFNLEHWKQRMRSTGNRLENFCFSTAVVLTTSDVDGASTRWLGRYSDDRWSTWTNAASLDLSTITGHRLATSSSMIKEMSQRMETTIQHNDGAASWTTTGNLDLDRRIITGSSTHHRQRWTSTGVITQSVLEHWKQQNRSTGSRIRLENVFFFYSALRTLAVDGASLSHRLTHLNIIKGMSQRMEKTIQQQRWSRILDGDRKSRLGQTHYRWIFHPSQTTLDINWNNHQT